MKNDKDLQSYIRLFLLRPVAKQLLPAISSCLLFLCSFGQTTNKQLANVNTIDQANQFIQSYPKLDGRLFTITSDKDTSYITLPLFNKKIGYTFPIDDLTFKIIESITYLEFRVSYIYLDGSQLSIHQIDSIRKVILDKFKNGVYFFDLVKEYTMDGSQNGDLGWFEENVMHKEFEKAVKLYKKGEIFTVDIPDKKWYYVTFKTFDDRTTKKLTILKIRNGK